MKLSAVLKLVRVSALPSAWADQFGGMALVVALVYKAGYGRVELSKLPLLLIMSMGVYLGGMALNDVLHVRKDRLLGKKRPIVTGEVSVAQAWLVTGLLFVIGLGAGIMAGCGGPVAALIALIFLYNHLAAGRIEGVEVKHPLGWTIGSVAVIATCRALHVLLPLLAHAGPGRLPDLLWNRGLAFLFAGSVFAYFCLVTVVSLFEDAGGGRGAIRLVQALLLPVVMLLPLYVLTQPGETSTPVLGIFVPLLVLAWLLMTLWLKLDAARADPVPPKLGACVGAGIRGEALLMAGFALMLAPLQPWWGLAALAMYPAGKVLGMWISPT